MKKTKKPQQRDIYWANLNPSQGSEQSGKRPVVVISGDTLNKHMPVCIVCPLSTQVKFPDTCTYIKKSQVNKLSQDSEIITFQVRTISRDRLGKKIGSIGQNELQDVVSKLGQILIY